MVNKGSKGQNVEKSPFRTGSLHFSGALVHRQEVHFVAVNQPACIASADVYAGDVDAGLCEKAGGRVSDLDVFL